MAAVIYERFYDTGINTGTIPEKGKNDSLGVTKMYNPPRHFSHL
jgi:hypothetical protein